MSCSKEKAIAKKNRIILVIGCPGAGKGTLAPKLASELGYVHVSVGDELRNWVEKNPSDTEVVTCVEQNELVPAEKLILILSYTLGIWNNLDTDAFIIDGFPRVVGQIQAFEREFRQPEMAISMDCPKEVAKNRFLSRNLAGRNDSEEVFNKRHDEFERNQEKILEHYRDWFSLVRVDTSEEVDVTWPKLLAAVQDHRKLFE